MYVSQEYRVCYPNPNPSAHRYSSNPSSPLLQHLKRQRLYVSYIATAVLAAIIAAVTTSAAPARLTLLLAAEIGDRSTCVLLALPLKSEAAILVLLLHPRALLLGVSGAALLQPSADPLQMRSCLLCELGPACRGAASAAAVGSNEAQSLHCLAVVVEPFIAS